MELGDRVVWSGCGDRIHAQLSVKGTTLPWGKQECYCEGELLRVFYDGNLVVEGLNGYVRLFHPTQVLVA